MQKVFYITRNSVVEGTECSPALDRFQRIEKLNNLLSLGWSIKAFRTEESGEYFVLEKG